MYLLIAKPIKFKMFCFVVLLMDGIILAGFTKSIFCWDWAGSHPQLSLQVSSLQLSQLQAVDVPKLLHRHRILEELSVKRLHSLPGKCWIPWEERG